jgi:4-amino-4-deoxy-L-arabinose transferase-like glycosyltransferase
MPLPTSLADSGPRRRFNRADTIAADESLTPPRMSDAKGPRQEWIVLAVVCGFLFFYGLGAFGLVGADEPRYAQVAREMLERGDWVTPTLGHQPWLEKPALLYWEEMIAFRIFGVSDWAARVPSAYSALLMIVTIYLFLRRFRPGAELDGALMTASGAAVIGFARAAGTDMPLAANFTMGLLAWYSWYESQERRWLIVASAFLGLATLAKGPVAGAFFVLIVVAFAAVRSDWRLITRTLWLPGIAAYCVVTLPWFVAVQWRNPEFFRVFILEHNLARFGTSLYRHQQPFWYFLVVALIGLLPWTIFTIAAMADTVRGWKAEGRRIFGGEDAFDVFLLLWLAVPIIFFSFSQSKLPGYILPALPAAPILVASFVRRRTSSGLTVSRATVVLHAIFAGILVMPCFLISYIVLVHRLPWGMGTLAAGVLSLVTAVMIVITLSGRFGLRLLHFSTLIPVVLSVAALIRLGGPAIDEENSARPVAAALALAEAGGTSPLPIAVFQTPRQTEYGLAFYRNQIVESYDRGEIPEGAHLLVTKEGAQSDVVKVVGSRVVTLIGANPAQHLEYYRVSGASR